MSKQTEYYAQLDKEDYCCCVSSLSGDTAGSDMIPLESYDFKYLGKKYDRNSGNWTEETRPMTRNRELKPNTRTLMDTQLAVMEAIAVGYEEQKQTELDYAESLAEIYEEILSVKGGKIR